MNFTFAGIHALIFFGSAVLLLILETLRRAQREPVRGRERWIVNLSLMLMVSMGGTLIFAAGPLDIAQAQQKAGESGWNLPLGVEILLVFLLLDFWRYWEHRVFHEVPLLWRVHLVHHSDTFIDVTTAERHHPFEALLTLPLAAMLVLALGLEPAGLMLYMIIAGMSALFTHANVRLPDTVDVRLRRILVTPSIHAIHHGSTPALADSNYGAVLSCWDRMFGTYSDPDTTQVDNFGLEYFHRRRERTLMNTLLQPFLYRAKMTVYEREPHEVAAAPAIALGPAWMRALSILVLILVFAVLAMWPTVVNVTSIWASTESYQYAWLVLPFFVYAMGWHYREELLQQLPQPDGAGLLLTAAALLLWSTGTLVQIGLLQHIALVILIQGIFLAVLGRGLWLRFLPVFLIMLFMVPSGDVLEFPLRVLTLDMIVFFCQLADLPYVADGFRISVGDNNYVVLDACSGLSFVLLAMFLSYSLGSLLYRNLFKIIGLTMLGGLLGIIANGLRVNAIVWVDWINGTQMDLGAHQEYQLLALIFMLAGIFLVISRLSLEAATEKVNAENPVEPSTLARYSPAAVVMTLGLMTLLQLLNGNTTPVSDYQLPSEKDWVVDATRNTGTLQLQRVGAFQATVVLALPGNESLNAPRPTQAAGAWRETRVEKHEACAEQRCYPLIHTQWNMAKSDAEKHVYYAYHIGSRVTDSQLLYRLASGWNQLLGRQESTGLISMMIDGDSPPIHELAGSYSRILQRL